MTSITYDEFKKDMKSQIEEVGYLMILTNLAWELTLLRHDNKIKTEEISKLKNTLEFLQNAK